MSEAGADKGRDRLAGALLIVAAAAAIALANSSLRPAYEALLHYEAGPAMPRLGRMSVHLWVADGLMSIFFLLVGLEVKREWFEGRLASAEVRRLPILAAIAGMAVPALIYLAVTGADPSIARGWAIPAATDIAFAIAVLAVLGRHAPPAIKVLLVTIAIVDDIGAVAIIALAYTTDLNLPALGGVLAVLAAMIALNRFGVRRLLPYLLGFATLWLLVTASGIHSTISGVLAALTIPLRTADDSSPLRRLEHALHPWVMFGVTPLFAFVSAGVALTGPALLFDPVPVGVALGLFIGKQLGVFGAIFAAVRTGFAGLPEGTRWREVYGAAVLCGIGFTMSLFIGALAFPDDLAHAEAAKIGTLAGSILSALCGWAILRFGSIGKVAAADVKEAEALFAQDEPESGNRE